MPKKSSIFGQPAQGHSKGSVHHRLSKHENWVEAILPADAEAGHIETPTNRRPLLVLAAAMALSLGLLGWRSFLLQVVNGQRNFELAEGNRIRQKVISAARGVIYDRNNKVLAGNTASFDVTVVPRLLPREGNARQAIYSRLAATVGGNAAEVAKKSESKGLFELQPQLVFSKLDREKALALDQSIGEMTGFSLDVNPIREYINSQLLSHFIGYTGRVSAEELQRTRDYLPSDYVGKLGLEKFYEETLRGVNGSQQTEVDATGRPIKILASKQAQAGQNLVLTIDSELQAKLAESLQSQLDASGATKASGVALDPRTGEILAAVSLPGYDNNLFSKGISAGDYNRLLNDKAQPLFNKVTAGAYPTGSIIKPLVAAAALQERVVTPGTTVNDTGQLEVPNQYDPKTKYIFRSWEPGGLGIVNLKRAIAVSSNIFFFTVGGGYADIRGLGIDRLASYYGKFGLGQKAGVDLPEETAGRVPTPAWKKQVKGEDWFTGDTYNVSVGQGDILASPLQMAVATAAVANGGKVMQPHFLKEILEPRGNDVRSFAPKTLRADFIAPEHLRLVREGMREVVSTGTACCQIEAQVSVPVAGKTGSAETDPGAKKPHAWFSAFAPYDNPTITIVALIENSGEGSRFAAPAVRDTLAWYFNRPSSTKN